MFTLNDFHAGDRVELHPATDLWMRGAQFGTVAKVGRKVLHFRPDVIPNSVYRISPEDIGRIMDKWENDAIQFPRLLAELRAIGLSSAQYSELMEAMDLNIDEIDELFERAETEWQRIKRAT